MSSDANGLSDAAIRAEIDQLTAKGHGLADGEPRVLGLRSLPDPSRTKKIGHTVAGRSVTVQVVHCVSALAAREALLDHASSTGENTTAKESATEGPRDWLVLVTDRPEEDLGAGILGHLIGQRLRQVDPWLGVKADFGATGIDRSLSRLPNDRAVARGLLAVLGESGQTWPAAPAGLLTLDHVASAVTRRVLGLPAGTVDGVAILRWTAAGKPIEGLAQLRNVGGDALVDVLVDWLARRCGAAADIVRAEFVEARPARLVPLGIAIQLLREARIADSEASAAWERFVMRHGLAYGKPGAADALGAQAMVVAGDLIQSGETWARGSSLLSEADSLLAEVGAAAVAGQSPLLASGLKKRFRDLAQALKNGGPTAIDAAWQAIATHSLVRFAPQRQRPSACAPSEAAVRLHRWLGMPAPATQTATLAEFSRRQVRDDAWVDSAIHDAAGGVADVDLSTALALVVTRARDVRATRDREFAKELARITEIGDGHEGVLSGDGDPVRPLEHVMRHVVAPLVKTKPTLLIVLDGMSARVAAEIVEDVLAEGRGWVEALPRGADHRLAGLAVLPTLTEHSRTSLLCGRLTTGNQQTEKKDHPSLVTSLGAGPARIFHKAELDTVADGHRLAHPVRDALVDGSVRLVTCVLNTIDDALDRSDPEGIDWRLDSVKHLAALLEEAADLGRAVVLTSDHGHVLERRKGSKHSGDATSARSRRDDGPGVRDGEVLVRGPRVLGADAAILAVDENMRYTDLKAGYHGGASPAEAVVPIVLLWPGAVPAITGDSLTGENGEPFPYVEAPPQRPGWWDHPLVAYPDIAASGSSQPAPSSPKPSRPKPSQRKVSDTAQQSLTGPGHDIVNGPAWQEQRAIAGRVAIDDDRCASLIDALAAAAGTRLPIGAVARVLGIPESRVQGAVAQVQKLLNIEGYAVVRQDQGMLVLDTGLLAEQFGVEL